MSLTGWLEYAVNLLLNLAIATAIWLFLKRLGLPILKVLRDSAKSVAPSVLAAFNKLKATYQAVWNWLIGLHEEKKAPQVQTSTSTGVQSETAAKPANNQAKPVSFDKASSGFIALAGSVACFYTDYYLLKLAFEVIIPTGAALYGKLDLTGISAGSMLIGLLLSGAMWRDAKLFTEDKVEELTKVGWYGLIFLSLMAGVLGYLRAVIIGGLSMPIALLLATLNGAVSYLVAVLFSCAYQNLLEPIIQSIFQGGVDQFSSFKVIVKFPLALIGWTVLFVPLSLVGVLYLLLFLPGLIVKMAEEYKTWRKEARTAWEERRKARQEQRLLDIQRRDEERQARDRVRASQRLARLEAQRKEQQKREEMLLQREQEKAERRLKISNLRHGLPLEEMDEAEQARVMDGKGVGS